MNLTSIDFDAYVDSDIQKWKKKFGVRKEHGICITDTGRPLSPKDLYTYLCQAIHTKGHFSMPAVIDSIKRQWNKYCCKDL